MRELPKGRFRRAAADAEGRMLSYVLVELFYEILNGFAVRRKFWHRLSQAFTSRWSFIPTTVIV